MFFKQERASVDRQILLLTLITNMKQTAASCRILLSMHENPNITAMSEQLYDFHVLPRFKHNVALQWDISSFWSDFMSNYTK